MLELCKMFVFIRYLRVVGGGYAIRLGLGLPVGAARSSWSQTDCDVLLNLFYPF